MFNNKKSLIVIVSISLILLVSVMSFVFLGDWFKTMSSSYLADIGSRVEINTALDSIKILKLSNSSLELISLNKQNLTITNIVIANVSCNTNINISLGENEIGIGHCVENLTVPSFYDVYIYFNNSFYYDNVFLSIPQE